MPGTSPDGTESAEPEHAIPHPHRSLRAWIRKFLSLPCAVLLAAQLLGILVYPFTESDSGRAAFSLFQLAVIFLAVRAVRMTPALTWISAITGVSAAIFTVWEVFDQDDRVIGSLSGVTHTLFYFYLAYALIRYMFADTKISKDEMYATGACFTVLAWGFAYAYDAVQNIWGADQFLAQHTGPLTWMELLFLSFTTMTGTGLSDISPVGAHARSVVMLEQLTGVYYLALVVARLLGLTLTRFKHDK